MQDVTGSIIGPATLRRTNADPYTFTAPGNTECSFMNITDYLDKPLLIQSFFQLFDILTGLTDPSVSRIDSFTHEWLSIPQLLAIIAYLDPSFLVSLNSIYVYRITEYFRGDQYDKTFDYLKGKYDGIDDKNKRLRVAKEFLSNGFE